MQSLWKSTAIKTRKFWDVRSATTLVALFNLSFLDYCSSLLSGISLSGLLLLPSHHLSVAWRECCPLLETLLLSHYAQPLQPLSSAWVGFQLLLWGLVRVVFGWKIKNTRKVKTKQKQKAFFLDKTGQNVQFFEEIRFFKATFNTKSFTYLLRFGFFLEGRGHKTDILK